MCEVLEFGLASDKKLLPHREASGDDSSSDIRTVSKAALVFPSVIRTKVKGVCNELSGRKQQQA